MSPNFDEGIFTLIYHLGAQSRASTFTDKRHYVSGVALCLCGTELLTDAVVVVGQIDTDTQDAQLKSQERGSNRSLIIASSSEEEGYSIKWSRRHQ